MAAATAVGRGGASVRAGDGACRRVAGETPPQGPEARRSSFAELAPAERHQLRIALKKLRYAAEFFRSLYGEKEVAQYLKRMSALQDDLGHLNDVATAETLMDKLAGEQADLRTRVAGESAAAS